MKVDLLKLSETELKESLNELSKEEVIDCFDELVKVLKEDYESFTMEVENTPFERIRRITGYLVGTLDRFNDAKKSEESMRVKHLTSVDFNK